MTDVGGIAADRLKSFVERIERMDEEIKGLNADKSDIYSEAKATGFDVKALRVVIRRRRMDSADRTEHDEMVDLYERAIAGTVVATRARTSSPQGEGDDPTDEAMARDEVSPTVEGESRETTEAEPKPGWEASGPVSSPAPDPFEIPDFLERRTAA